MKEIERKFLLNSETNRFLWGKPSKQIVQSYLLVGTEEVRVRSIDNSYYITIKKFISNTEREETEIAIPSQLGKQLIELSTIKIYKTRYNFERWIVDSYDGNKNGWLNNLYVAEIEFSSSEENLPELPFDLRKCIIKEITDDPRYKNQKLAEYGTPND